MDETMWQEVSDEPLVIRSYFEHEDEWIRLQVAIAEPQTSDGCQAFVRFVDDKAYEGVTVPRLLEVVPPDAFIGYSGTGFVFLVDERTLTDPEHPILAVNFYDWEEGLEDQGKGPHYGTSFRIIPSEMWGPTCNLPIDNMGWEEFAESVDDDGVFRGFPSPHGSS